MRILGLIGSSRSLGNTELLVTEVAKATVEMDPQICVHLVRLTDLHLSYCTGCMHCAMQEGGGCPLEDDMEFLLAEFKAADALILGAPAYTLLPPGPLKLIADRLIMHLGRCDWAVPKPAVTVGVAGLPRWSELLLPLLNGMTLGQGFRLVDSFLAYGAGPGAVLLDANNVQRAQTAGHCLSRALSGQDVRADFGPGRCPVCGADFFRFTKDGIECPLCLAAGKLSKGVPIFDACPDNRWQTDAMRRHFTEWIQGTFPSYLEQRPDIRRLQRPYRKHIFPFVNPRQG